MMGDDRTFQDDYQDARDREGMSMVTFNRCKRATFMVAYAKLLQVRGNWTIKCSVFVANSI